MIKINRILELQVSLQILLLSPTVLRDEAHRIPRVDDTANNEALWLRDPTPLQTPLCLQSRVVSLCCSHIRCGEEVLDIELLIAILGKWIKFFFLLEVEKQNLNSH